MSGFNRITPPTEEASKLLKLEIELLRVDASLKYAIKLEQAARNLLSALTPEGEVEKLAARDLAALLGENHV